MTVRAINPDTGDIVTSNVQFLTGAEEVAQTIKTRLALFQGEYFRNRAEGTPWFQTILGKGGSLSSKDAAIKNRVINTPDVVKITRYTASFDTSTRTYNISMSVLTKFGAVEIDFGGAV